MSFCSRSLRVHQIFSANTDLGKTILTTALCIANAQAGQRVFYLKPVSTGSLEDADDVHVARFTRGTVNVECLYRYHEPVSPHLAAKIGSTAKGPLTDVAFVKSVATHIRQSAAQLSGSEQGWLAIETAGGALSPIPTGTSQLDAYRPFRLPIILIGDHRLGGISTTLAAYESLHARGYDVDYALLFKDDYYQNAEYLSQWFAERKIICETVALPPPKSSNAADDHRNLANYYSEVTKGGSTIDGAVKHLQKIHTRRLNDLESMRSRTLTSIWYPFVQHGTLKGEMDITVIDSALGDFFTTYHGAEDPVSGSIFQPEFDGSASWWTQAVGHASVDLTMASAYAAGRYGHVIFPQASHLPAVTLAERLLNTVGCGWGARVFFSDNGSTGMEVALKMAMRATATRTGAQPADRDMCVLGLKGSYHGDTIGSMDACEPGVFNASVEWYRGRGFWFDSPTVRITKGLHVVAWNGQTHMFPDLDAIYNTGKRLTSDLARQYDDHIQHTLERLVEDGQRFGALCIEPILMGAGGMLFVDPLFQHLLIQIVRRNGKLFSTSSGHDTSSPESCTWSGLPVIFDEVFSGLYRLGFQTPTTVLNAVPDIGVYAKILTGGLLPMGVTLASKSIFEAFHGPDKKTALLHGHSYTAYPMGCTVANKTLDLIEKIRESDNWRMAQKMWASKSCKIWSLWNPDFVMRLSNLNSVDRVMAMGTVLAFEIAADKSGYTSTSAQSQLSSLCENVPGASQAPGGEPFSIHYRTLGNVGYFMTSLNTEPDVLRAVEVKILRALSTINNSNQVSRTA